MAGEAVQPWYERFFVLIAVFLLHVAAILFLLLQHSKSGEEVLKPATITLVNFDAEKPATAVPPPPKLPAKIAETFDPVAKISILDDGQPDASAGATMTCVPQTALLDALLRDEALVDIIRRAPPDTRSVADAIVMWNDGWSAAALAADSPLVRIRENIEQSLKEIPAKCLDEPIVGPRLLPIPDVTGEGAVFLVFGSGNWAWRALLVDTAQTQPERGAKRNFIMP